MPLALTALPAVLDRLRSELSGEAADVFERIMRTNLDSVLQRWDDGTAFLITGDIPAMWLRDSATQLRPYLLLADDDVELQDVLVGVARRQSRFVHGLRRFLCRRHQRILAVRRGCSFAKWPR